MPLRLSISTALIYAFHASVSLPYRIGEIVPFQAHSMYLNFCHFSSCTPFSITVHNTLSLGWNHNIIFLCPHTNFSPFTWLTETVHYFIFLLHSYKKILHHLQTQCHLKKRNKIKYTISYHKNSEKYNWQARNLWQINHYPALPTSRYSKLLHSFKIYYHPSCNNRDIHM